MCGTEMAAEFKRRFKYAYLRSQHEESDGIGTTRSRQSLSLHNVGRQIHIR